MITLLILYILSKEKASCFEAYLQVAPSRSYRLLTLLSFTLPSFINWLLAESISISFLVSILA